MVRVHSVSRVEPSKPCTAREVNLHKYRDAKWIGQWRGSSVNRSDSTDSIKGLKV